MDKLLGSILDQIRSAWRFKHVAVVAAWAVAVVGWCYVLTIPNVYQSETRVFVDSETALKPMLEGLTVGSPDVMTQVRMMTLALLSRPHLEEVAQETDLALRADDEAQFQNLLDGLARRIKITGGRDNLFSISYVDREHAMADRVVRTLLTNFVEDSMGQNREDTTEAQKFIVQQIRELEIRLDQAEQNLANFKKQNVGLMPDDRGDYYARLQQAQAVQERIRAKLSGATARRDELRRQIEGEEPVYGVVDSLDTNAAGGGGYDARIQQLRTHLDDLLLKYTEKHPNVIAVQDTIKELETRRSADQLALSGLSPDTLRPGLAENPVYQSMRIALSEADVEIVTLENQLRRQERDVNNLKRLVDTVPEVEAELKRLNRDYLVTQKQHQGLIGRLESARLAQEADQRNEDMRFRIIDPPLTPLEPVAPNRPLLLSVVLVGALGAGLALAVFFAQIRPVFLNREHLRIVTQLPVIGSVSMVSNKSAMRPVTVALSLATAALLVVFGVAMTYHQQGADFLGQIL